MSILDRVMTIFDFRDPKTGRKEPTTDGSRKGRGSQVSFQSKCPVNWNRRPHCRFSSSAGGTADEEKRRWGRLFGIAPRPRDDILRVGRLNGDLQFGIAPRPRDDILHLSGESMHHPFGIAPRPRDDILDTVRQVSYRWFGIAPRPRDDILGSARGTSSRRFGIAPRPRDDILRAAQPVCAEVFGIAPRPRDDILQDAHDEWCRCVWDCPPSKG